MRKSTWLGIVGLVLCSSFAYAQEKTQTICDVNDVKNKCPGADCVCVNDVFEIVFDNDASLTNSIFEYETFTQDQPIAVTIITDTQTAKVQGWSYGVKHDMTALVSTSAAIAGTDAAALLDFGFDATSNVDIETCDTVPACKNRTDGGGWISAVVLSFTKPVELPLKRNTIAKAGYTLSKDVGAAGTLVQVSNTLAKKKSPPADVNLTIDGKSRKWTTAIDGWIKLKGGAVVEICDNNIDDDADGKIDCLDSDCPACPPENCDNDIDDDKDGQIDCADSDCTGNPACQATEICDNNIDDDADGKIDCLDSDCPACPPENCDNDIDDDKDGATDCADTDCATNPVCAVTCQDWALYFGPAATDQVAAVGAGPTYVITSRNKTAALAFQLGVKVTAGSPNSWAFSGALGADANRLVELIITDDTGTSQTPVAGNTATSTVLPVGNIERGAAIAGFNARDFFAFDTNPGVGGPGFYVGYVADTNPPQGAGNKIPATGTGTPCPVNEILKVTIGAVDNRFIRGDVDGNGKLNVTDAVLIIQIIVGNLTSRGCDDALDADDNGSLAVTDAINVLQYVFQKGPNLSPPFPACGTDPTADSLGCATATTTCQ